MQCLNILTGNLDRKGGLMFPNGVFAQILGAEKVKDGQVPYGRWHSRISGAPEVASQLPTAVLAEEIETPGEGQIRRSEEHTSGTPVTNAHLVCRLLLDTKYIKQYN